MATEDNSTTLSDRERRDFFHQVFPLGFAGADVVREIAPEGWEKSPLLTCFHPSPKQVLAECVSRHRRHRELIDLRCKNTGLAPETAASPEPTMGDAMADWEDRPVNMSEELTSIVGACLWDVFSDNHKVLAADGRAVDIGSFRGASAFLDEFVMGSQKHWDGGEDYRFYMGTNMISGRADLTPLYRMIFRRLNLLGANWEYEFPQLHFVDLTPLNQALQNEDGTYSPSEAFAQDHEERQKQAELEKARADLEKANDEARRAALEQPTPPTVIAYQEIYGRDPKGWPPC